mgnify:CR=1 FL=1
MNSVQRIIIFFTQSVLIFCQTNSDNYFLHQSKKLFYDAGKDWNSLTVFGPVRYTSKTENELKKIPSSTYIDLNIGLNSNKDYYSLYGFGHFVYKNHYYGYLNPTFIVREVEHHQSDIRTNLLNSWNDHSGLGFKNSWVVLQIGRGKENWGAGEDIQLALSENSSPYDYFLLASDYGNIRVRYIYGLLEKIQSNINRYITARAFEWTNKKSLIVGLSETVIYSGENRSFEISYLNPISSHLEIELNNRLNSNDDNSSNAVWQVHFDYLINKNTRLSINYLLDEFVLDPDIEIGKENGKAFSYRLSYTPQLRNGHILTLYSSFVHVGTPTFRHGSGINNFVQNGRPLGWYRGSDGRELCIGLNYFNHKNLIFNFYNGVLHRGDETITNRIFEPYSDYLRGPFPSGIVDKTYFFGTSIFYYFKANYSISAAFNNFKNKKVFELKINIPINKLFSNGS